LSSSHGSETLARGRAPQVSAPRRTFGQVVDGPRIARPS
jgi:hypothetical protein